MPKEIVHWHLAEKILTEIELPDQKSTKNHLDVILLGAVFHDALYYHASDDENFSKIPDALHGSNGEDTFIVVRDLLKKVEAHSDNESKNILLALAIGLITHISVDINFHPFVYYYTGHYYSKNESERVAAQRRHRYFESLLDLHFCQHNIGMKEYNMQALCKSALPKLEKSLPNGISLDELAYTISIKDIIKCYKNYCLARKIYNNYHLSKALIIAKPLLSSSLEAISTLSYHHIPFDNPIDFLRSFNYEHPVNGKKNRTSIEEAAQRSIEQALIYTKRIAARDDLGVGPSLETGLVRSLANDMKYFYDWGTS